MKEFHCLNKKETLEEKSFENDLLAFIDEEEAEELGIEESETFTISSPDQANWYLKKIKEIRAQKEEAENTAKEKVQAYQDKVSKWKESVMSPLEYQEKYFLNLLEVYASNALEGTSKKSLKLIEGTLGFRKQAPQYDYEDEILLDFVKANAKDYVKESFSVDKAKLKKEASIVKGKLVIDGKSIPGVTITEREDKFDVK